MGAPAVCDQCPPPISDHVIWEPDETCGGWMQLQGLGLHRLLARLAEVKPTPLTADRTMTGPTTIEMCMLRPVNQLGGER